MPIISTEKSRKNLKREYRLRFLTVLLFVLVCVFFLILVFILPSYTLLGFYEKSYQAAKTSEEQIKIQKINSDYDKKIDDIYELSQKVDMRTSNHVSVIKKLFAYAGDYLTFDAVELSGAEKEITITLRGRAQSREELLLFETKIDSDPKFSGFDIPIDTLTKQVDVSFNITFTYNEI